MSHSKRVSLLISVCILVVLASSCLIPEQFDAKIQINKDGTYSLTYDGILTHALARGGAIEGKLSPQNEMELKTLEAELSKDANFKKVSYQGQGRFKVLYERSGKLTTPVYFLSKDNAIVTISPTFDGNAEVKSFNVSKDDVAMFSQLKMNLDGRIEVKTDAKVLKHNAKDTPKLGGLWGAYTWQIKSIDDPAPYMLVELERGQQKPVVGANSPGEVVRAYWLDANAGKYEDLDAYYSKALRSSANRERVEALGGRKNFVDRTTKNGTITKVEIEKEDIKEQTALVRTALQFKDGTTEHDVKVLIIEGGSWKVPADDELTPQQRAERFLEAASARDFDTLFVGTLQYMQRVAGIVQGNPKVLWSKLYWEFYEGQKALFLKEEIDPFQQLELSIAAGVGGEHVVNYLRGLCALLPPGAEWKIEEWRSQRGGQSSSFITGQPTDQTVAWVSVSYQTPDTAALIENRPLKKTLLEIALHTDSGLFIRARRLGKGDEYWKESPLRVLNVRWIAEDLGGLSFRVTVIGGTPPYTSTSQCGRYILEKTQGADISNNPESHIIQVILRARIPDSEFPLNCSVTVSDSKGNTDVVGLTVPKWFTGLMNGFCWVRTPWYEWGQERPQYCGSGVRELRTFTRWDQLMASARTKLNTRDIDGAIADYTEAIRLDPKLVEAYVKRGDARLKKRDADVAGAVADYTEAIRLDSKNAEAYLGRGRAKLRKRDNDGAITDFTEAMRLNPESVDAYESRAFAKTLKRDYEGAIADYSEAIRLEPKNAEAYMQLGVYRSRLGDNDGAIRDLSRAIQLDPENPIRYGARAPVEGKRGNYHGEIADYTKAIELFEGRSEKMKGLESHGLAGAYCNRGLAKQKIGDDTGAKADFSAANRIDPGFGCDLESILKQKKSTSRKDNSTDNVDLQRGGELVQPPQPVFNRDQWQTNIAERLRSLVQMPPPKTDWRELVVMKATGKFDTYESLYLLAVNRRNLAADALNAASEFLKKNDLANVEKWVETSNQFYTESESLFKAANDVAINSAEASLNAAKALEPVIKGGLTLGEFGVTLQCGGNHLCSESASAIVLMIEYGLDSSIYGKEEAQRNAVAKAVAKTLLHTDNLEGWLQKRTTYVIGRSGLYTKLDEILANPDFQKQVMEFLAEAGAFTVTAESETVIAEAIKKMDGFVMSASNLQPGITSTSQPPAGPPSVPVVAPVAAPAEPGVGWLDPVALMKDCCRLSEGASGSSSSSIDRQTFEQKYKGNTVRYAGKVKKAHSGRGFIWFTGGGTWPCTWIVEALFPKDKRALANKELEGTTVTVEGKITDLIVPFLDIGTTGGGGSARTIRLVDSVIIESGVAKE